MERVATETPNGKETRLEKAMRLLSEGRVGLRGEMRFVVEGDSAKHKVDLSGVGTCECQASAFGGLTCSHKLASELLASRMRGAA